MADQAERLRALIETARPLARDENAALPMIAVSGARAGVGSTTVSLNLAAVLADRGERVLLVDGSQHRSDVIEAPLVRRKVENSLGDVLAGKCSVREAIVAGPAGIQMLVNSCDARTTPDFSRRAQQRLLEELQSLDGSIDLIVMDVGPGQSSWTQRLWQRAKLVLLVTTPDDATVLDAYAALKLGVSEARDVEIRLLVNQADSEMAAIDTQRRIQNSCQRFLSRSIPALPALPRHMRESLAAQAAPRVWEVPNSQFGHAALWLGRAVGELLNLDDGGASTEDQACFVQAA
jgi:flagellar biosynthesis protein FlhG